MIEKLFRYAQFVIAVALITACGPIVSQSPELKEAKVQTVAILPALVRSDIRRERVDYIRKSIGRDLETNGYVVLNQDIVDRVCKDAVCADRAQFAQRYGVDGLVEIELDSVDRANFVAGYYNTIQGTVRLLSSGGSKPLLSVQHTERDKGGFLFNTGQVLQGLVQTVENTGDDSFNRLAERYAKAVSSKLPKPSGASSLGKVSDVDITQTVVTPLGGSRVQICATGNPSATAILAVDKIRTPLREGNSGEYCGVFLLDGLVRPDSQVRIELRSPFGVTAQSVLDAAPLLACSPSRIVQAQSGGRPSLELACADTLTPEQRTACESELAVCGKSALHIYRAASPAGPFQKVAEVNQTPWFDKQSKAGMPGVYAVMAVSRNGGQSLPYTLNDLKQ